MGRPPAGAAVVDMESSGHIIIERAIDVGCALMGALAGYYFALRLEKRKEETQHARVAYEACLKLRGTLADWMNNIADATRAEHSVEDVMKRLQTVYEHEHFEGTIRDRFYDLRDEPLCAGLFGKTNAFTTQAFGSKGQIRMALTAGDFARNYSGHRDDALRELRRVYDDFRNELERVIPLLQRKARL